MRLTTFLCMMVLAFTVQEIAAQDFQTDLNGFRLRQYRDAVHAELGNPGKTGDSSEDIEYEAFLLKEDPLLYMVFQYRKSEPSLIWSIQMTGSDPSADPGFRGLKLGIGPSSVTSILGPPTEKVDVGEHGTRWGFDGSNYSIEIGADGKLSSIRVADEDADAKEVPDFAALPVFLDVLKTLESGSNSALADLVAPDMELYLDGETIYFGHRMSTEIKSDTSKIFRRIRELSRELRKVDTGDPKAYEENARLRLGSSPMHVLKFKSVPRVREIVFKWDGKRWRLWEFDAGRPKTVSNNSEYLRRTFRSIIEEAVPKLEKDPNVVLFDKDKQPRLALSYDPLLSSISGVYSGQVRATSLLRKELMEFSLQTFGRDKSMAENYSQEIGIIEDGQIHWVTIDKDEFERFRGSIKKNDPVTVFMSWIGIAYEKGKPDFLFIAHGFEADVQAGLKTQVVRAH